MYHKLINKTLKVLFNEGLSSSSKHSPEGKETSTTILNFESSFPEKKLALIENLKIQSSIFLSTKSI